MKPQWLTISFLGQYEFVKRGAAPVVGITKLEGVTLEQLKRPRKEIPVESVSTGVASEATSTPSMPASPSSA